MFATAVFSGKTALVTGGGSGIGKAIATQLLQNGATVWICGRNEARLQSATEELSVFGQCQWAVADIRQPEALLQLADRIAAQGQGLDLLVNNAGGQFLAPAERIPYKGWLAVIENNLHGTWLTTTTMAQRFFIPQRQGVVVNIIANMFRGFPGMAHTGAARAGVDNLTKTLAVEWSVYNIRVNAVAPGIIQTSGLETYPPEVQQMLNRAPKTIPAKRLGTADEVAHSVLFLASPFAEYITGETLYVDGGQRLWGDMWDLN
ncbi:SDR family oxidoreductase [Eisenibacter elegans]|jgi:citronellol/citronellal dehydrogenase|uniref:SDR family oxidoreductase n=1 Tax=Eisenibacter elegans TaxID=997 RepID=UPI000423C663|nr:SDR family oxidoreductase [Eisenibacter elegans]